MTSPSVPAPILTIAIPTWKRASLLAATLAQLQREISPLNVSLVEVLVSDNGSPDETPSVVAQAEAQGLKLRYVRNPVNIGSDLNIAQCFNLAAGRYVLILGDDDLPVDGSLAFLLDLLTDPQIGVVCLRTYGFDRDFRKEYPGAGGAVERFSDAGAFLARIGAQMTLISACIINKSLLPGINADAFKGDNLVQTHLVVLAALRGRASVYVDRYTVACLRNNTGGYDFSNVFVKNLFGLLDSHRSDGLTESAIRGVGHHMLRSFYPFQVSKILRKQGHLSEATLSNFNQRFGSDWQYLLWVYPIVAWPRLPALLWGAVTTVIGRILNGELRRGVYFLFNRIRG